MDRRRKDGLAGRGIARTGRRLTLLLTAGVVAPAGMLALSLPTPTMASASPTYLDLAGQELPGATAGQAYSAQIQVSGGTEPYTFTVAEGTVPEGLTVSASGLVSGVPLQQNSEPLNSRFYVTAVDSGTPQETSQPGYEAYVDITVTPSDYQPPPPLQITTTSVPEAQVGQAYSFTMEASGGTPPYQWTAGGGEIPPGFTMSSDGTLSGSSNEEEQGTFDVFVTDSGYAPVNQYQWVNARQAASVSVTLTVSSGIPTLDPALIDFWAVYNITPNGLPLAQSELDALLADLPGGGPGGLVGYVEQEVINQVCDLTSGEIGRGCLI
jgi:hypothetical protein